MQTRKDNPKCKTCPFFVECLSFHNETISPSKCIAYHFKLSIHYSQNNPSLSIPEESQIWNQRIAEFLNYHCQ